MTQKIMNRRLALVSGLAVLSAVACAPKAGAEPVEEVVPFSGTVEATCTFSNTTAGILQQNPSYPEYIFGGYDSFGGSRGETTVNCTSGGNITVSKPEVKAAPNGFTPSYEMAEVRAKNGYIQNGGTSNQNNQYTASPIDIEANTDVALSVGMYAHNQAGILPAGEYNYEVTLTATPN